MAELSGYNMKVRVNSSVFSVEEVHATGRVGEHNTTNSEGGGYAERIRTVRDCEVRLKKASLDIAAEVPYVAPLNLFEGQTVTLSVYPDDITSTPLNGTFLVVEADWNPNANAGQPWSAHLKNVGTYHWFGEVA